MKHARKLAGILLAMVMALALALPAFAEDPTYTITIKNATDGHIYEAYQIFKGNLTTEGEGESQQFILSDIDWGTGVSDTNISFTYTEGEDSVTVSTAADIAKALQGGKIDVNAFLNTISGKLSTTCKTSGNTDNYQYNKTDETYTISELPAGYYLVKDTDSVTVPDAATKYILQVVGDTTVKVKSAVPTVEKKVKENNKQVTGNTDDRIKDYTLDEGYNDVADYNIGDSVPFQLIGTLPERYDDYTTYKYVFHDTLSAGLTYNGDVTVSVVNIDNDGNKNKTDVTSSFEIGNEEKTVDGKKVTQLTISCANLKTINKVTKSSYILVEYTATLNTNAIVGLPGNPNEVYLQFSNNPNQGHEGEIGTTPKDEVIVFTYKLDVTKVDGENETTKLKDAEFVLMDSTKRKYAKIENGKFAGWANTEAEGTTLTSNDEGLFSVTGLDDGTYYLKETKAPDGYNLLKNPVEVKITATTANNQTWSGTASDALTEINVKVDDGTPEVGTVADGKVNITIENNKGSTLPSTGGIGTTIFYVVGSILVLAAVVLLITKKRMSEDK